MVRLKPETRQRYNVMRVVSSYLPLLTLVLEKTRRCDIPVVCARETWNTSVHLVRQFLFLHPGYLRFFYAAASYVHTGSRGVCPARDDAPGAVDVPASVGSTLKAAEGSTVTTGRSVLISLGVTPSLLACQHVYVCEAAT